jgi:hypothetical protein
MSLPILIRQSERKERPPNKSNSLHVFRWALLAKFKRWARQLGWPKPLWTLQERQTTTVATRLTYLNIGLPPSKLRLFWQRRVMQDVKVS